VPGGLGSRTRPGLAFLAGTESEVRLADAPKFGYRWVERKPIRPRGRDLRPHPESRVADSLRRVPGTSSSPWSGGRSSVPPSIGSALLLLFCANATYAGGSGPDEWGVSLRLLWGCCSASSGRAIGAAVVAMIMSAGSRIQVRRTVTAQSRCLRKAPRWRRASTPSITSSSGDAFFFLLIVGFCLLVQVWRRRSAHPGRQSQHAPRVTWTIVPRSWS
jgi:hypothetical protein